MSYRSIPIMIEKPKKPVIITQLPYPQNHATLVALSLPPKSIFKFLEYILT